MASVSLLNNKQFNKLIAKDIQNVNDKIDEVNANSLNRYEGIDDVVKPDVLPNYEGGDGNVNTTGPKGFGFEGYEQVDGYKLIKYLQENHSKISSKYSFPEFLLTTNAYES